MTTMKVSLPILVSRSMQRGTCTMFQLLILPGTREIKLKGPMVVEVTTPPLHKLDVTLNTESRLAWMCVLVMILKLHY